MDPLACLMRCDQAISDCDIEESRSAAEDYREWRMNGGFEPADVYGRRGDIFARECEHRIHDLIQHQITERVRP